jgi:hypothetical protein
MELLRRIGWVAAIVIVFLWMVRDPAGASKATHAIGHFTIQAADSFGQLMSSL